MPACRTRAWRKCGHWTADYEYGPLPPGSKPSGWLARKSKKFLTKPRNFVQAFIDLDNHELLYFFMGLTLFGVEISMELKES
jgi:hypothetical protein